ncbi:MAG: flagellar hook protein FlgE [Antarcticimicrobium sp.]|uniref:flagellar hook protein FlgE n=1 Tax=Antarcticimicrobium sp. TaxID=2824147 RepID=UPI00260D8CE5|nr:flagellar hook protein FlgE [Antarcticimicrobium sp.]MDF1716258.1 flagellar hook protein FlgE [Antarcticimicrobium sp.]
MSISSALQIGVSGLQANSKAVGGISENIANANTVGYKRGFSHFVTTAASGGAADGVLSVSAVEAMDITHAGGLIPTDSSTDLAISGAGFFAVSLRPDETVQTNYMLTRAGSFLPDKDGNLVNAAGYYLAGYRYDLDGTLPDVDRGTFGDMETVNIGNITLSAAATTEISTVGNLPAQEAGLATPGAPFTTSSEYFSPLGASERLSFSWQPTATDNRWDVTVSDKDGTALGTVTVDFNDSGSLAGSPSAYSGVTSTATAPAGFAFDTATGKATVTVDSGGTPQTITVNLGSPDKFDGVTQFAGDFSQTFTRDGSSVGEVIRTEIDEDGVLYGIFDNGQRRALYEIPVATVANPHGLYEMRGNAYGLTVDTGTFLAMKANTGATGAISSSQLEGSNVDIAEEMTDLIKAQRAFSTNAKVVTTVDEMMSETAQLKR